MWQRRFDQSQSLLCLDEITVRKWSESWTQTVKAEKNMPILTFDVWTNAKMFYLKKIYI